MHPFKTFVFLSVILIIAILFRYNDSVVIPTLPTLLDRKELPANDSAIFSSKIVKQSVPVSDTIATFFEGYPADSCLRNFIHQLSKSGDTIVRVIFFGDSQLEGDFFTMPVRNALQRNFGGNGIGFMPVEMYFNTTEKVAIVTSDFEKHVIHTGSNEDEGFGLYGRFFVPTEVDAELRIKNRNENHQFQKLKVIYSGESKLKVTDGKVFSQEYSLNSSEIRIIDIDFTSTPKDLKLKFSENRQLKLFGILLDPLKGVVVDHVAFRGNLNLMLNCFGDETVQQMCQVLQPSLVVLQYGLNVIPDVRPNYESYRIALQRDIHLLKNYLPNASILVIGAPDMAHKVKGEMQSYENINLIIEAQKNAALAEQVAFWNMRAAMGGNGSVINWVADGLARTDYAHLNAKGSDKVATIFTNDLLQVINRKKVSND